MWKGLFLLYFINYWNKTSSVQGNWRRMWKPTMQEKRFGKCWCRWCYQIPSKINRLLHKQFQLQMTKTARSMWWRFVFSFFSVYHLKFPSNFQVCCLLSSFPCHGHTAGRTEWCKQARIKIKLILILVLFWPINHQMFY